MAQSSNNYPQYLKGQLIVFTGQFHPYPKNTLINMCQKLGAKTSNIITKATSVLIQGSYIQNFNGKVQYNRDINSTKKTRQALRKGVKVINNDKMDQYFVSKTGKTVTQIMIIIQNGFSFDTQKSQNSIQKYISPIKNNQNQKINLSQKTNKYHENNFNTKNNNNLSIQNKNEKQRFATLVLQQLFKYGYGDLINSNEAKMQFKKIAIDYFIQDTHPNEIFIQLQYFTQKMSRRLHIVEIMQQIKTSMLGNKNEKLQKLCNKNEEIQKIPQPIIKKKSLLIQQKKSQNRNSNPQQFQPTCKQNSVKPQINEVKSEINQLNCQVLSSFQLFNEEFNKDKGVCYENFNDISDEIDEILNSQNIEVIHQKANQLKKLTEKCFFIYRTLSKSINKFGNQLKALFQNQSEIINKNDSKQLTTQKSNKIFVSKEEKTQKLSKKEQLVIKKQSKLIEQMQRQVKQPCLSSKFSVQKNQRQYLKGNHEYIIKQHSIIEQEVKSCQVQNKNFQEKKTEKKINQYYNFFQSKDKVKQNNQSFKLSTPFQIQKKQLKLLPPKEYLSKHFPLNQHQRRYRILQSKGLQSQDRIFTDVYYLDHSEVKIDFSQFIKYDWRNVERFNFSSCQITSQDWNTFCQNSSLFPSLRFLVIPSNKISQVRKDQLKKLLPHMRAIHFGSIQSENKKNPLSLQSIQQIEKFLNGKDQEKYIIMYK